VIWHDGCAQQSTGHNVWTKITRPKYERAGQRYAGDLTDAEWAMIEPHMPVAKPLGRPRDTDLRAVVKAILYMARTSCQWRLLPKDFPWFVCWQGRSVAIGIAGGTVQVTLVAGEGMEFRIAAATLKLAPGSSPPAPPCFRSPVRL
jgi:transposase